MVFSKQIIIVIIAIMTQNATFINYFIIIKVAIKLLNNTTIIIIMLKIILANFLDFI